MMKKERIYICPACGFPLRRLSDKQWIKSYCEQKNRPVHAYLEKRK